MAFDTLREEALTGSYESIVDVLTQGQADTLGTQETPGRAARAMLEMTSGYAVDVPGLFTTFEANGYDEMVVVREIPFVSLCEHHLLPFTGQAHIGYVPSDKIVGLSKLARVTHAYAQRLQVQERMTTQIADAIEEHLAPVGTIVVVEASHSCMACRGVKVAGAVAVTSSVRGAMMEKPAARAEALALIMGR